MGFNPDPSKQAQEVIFSRELQKKVIFPFNIIPVKQASSQKHLRMMLDPKLNFLEDYYGSWKTSYLEHH